MVENNFYLTVAVDRLPQYMSGFDQEKKQSGRNN